MEKPLHIPTLCKKSQFFSTDEYNVYLKFECHQPSGSFKLRGIGNLCQHAVKNGCKRLVCSSGGNAGEFLLILIDIGYKDIVN